MATPEVPTQLPTLDIHEVSIRLLRIYLEVKEELMEIKYQVRSIEENVGPSDGFKAATEELPAAKSLIFNKISFETLENPSSINENEDDDLFHPNLQFESESSREEWFWRIGLRNSCGLIAETLASLASELSGRFKHDHYKAHKLTNGKVEEMKVWFEDVKILLLLLIEREYNRIVFDGQEMNLSIDKNNTRMHPVIFIGNDKPVFDPAALFFGLRGLKGEIVGMFETFENYRQRLPDTIWMANRVFDVKSYEGNMSVQMQMEIKRFNSYPDNQLVQPLSTIKTRMIERFMADLENGLTWCAYCGKSGEVFQCSKCKTKIYCGKKCQTLHWKSHKLICMAVEVQV